MSFRLFGSVMATGAAPGPVTPPDSYGRAPRALPKPSDFAEISAGRTGPHTKSREI